MKYYFAGGLFSHKEIIGNRLLAEAITGVSHGKWEALLPQDAENQLRDDPKAIRDNDFEMVLQSDAALFNFDGTELDSGTVAEFMAALLGILFIIIKIIILIIMEIIVFISMEKKEIIVDILLELILITS